MRKHKRIATAVAFASVAALLLAACSTVSGSDGEDAAPEEGDFTIAFMHDLTGPVGPYGIAEVRGGTLAVDEFNEAGGLDGRFAKTVEHDLGSDAAATTTAIRALSADGAVAIHGPSSSSAVVVGAPIAQQSEIVFVAPSSTENFDEDVLNPWTFRVGPIQALAFDTIMPQILEAAEDPKRVAIFYDSAQAAPVEERELVEEHAAEFGYEVVGVETIPAGETDVTDEVSRIVAAKPDAIWMAHTAAENAAFMTEVRARGLDATFMGGLSFSNQKTFELAGEASEGSLTFIPFLASSPDPAVQEFVAAFKEEYGEEPDVFAALAYDAMVAILDAIKEAGSTDRTAIRDAMSTLSTEGAVGPIEYDGGQDNVGAEYVLVTVEDGVLVPLN